jgi:acetyl esterase/lipase
MSFHGGWVLGDFPTLVRDLVNYSGATAVFVNYTPSPEAGYGVAINQAYAATKWVATHGKDIKVDGSRLAMAGTVSAATWQPPSASWPRMRGSRRSAIKYFPGR